MKKTVVIGSDHAGYPLKNAIRDTLTAEGYTVIDVGTDSPEICDYPVYAARVADTIIDGNAPIGILCCGTGIGMSIAANKIKGIRAACCSDIFSAKYTRIHNDANILCLGARVIGEGLAMELVHAFLENAFAGGKHARRVAMITELENR